MKKRLMFVDDEPSILRSIRRTLRSWEDQWELLLVDNPLEAVSLARSQFVDVIVTDVRMPQISGLELLGQLQATPETRDIPVIIVTGEADRALKRTALDMGAADLLNKPVDPDDLVARIRSALRIKDYQDQLRNCNADLERKVRERTRELLDSRVDIVWRLSKAAEYRDEETGNHVLRVGCYARTVGRALGLSTNFVDDLFLAAPLHDIGKIGVPDRVLRKPGRLNEEEWDLMRRHCDIGASILQDDTKISAIWRHQAGESLFAPLPSPLSIANPIVEFATSIARAHHERWDGTGYPARLSKDEIPIEARIVAVCDVFDALRSQRPYKPAFSLDQSMAILREGRGSHFDPDVHDAMVDSLEEILSAERMLADSPIHACEGQRHETRLVC